MTYRVFVQLKKQANHPNVQLHNRDCLGLVSLYWFDREAYEGSLKFSVVSDGKLKNDCKYCNKATFIIVAGNENIPRDNEIIIDYRVKSVIYILLYTRIQIMHMLDIR